MKTSVKTSIELWVGSADRSNQNFDFRKNSYIFCSFAEDMAKGIIGFIVFNVNAMKYELWQGEKRERIISVYNS